MKSLIVFLALAIAVALAQQPPKGVTYCTSSDSNCHTFENYYQQYCDGGEVPPVCKAMIPIVSTGGSAGGHEYCTDLWNIASSCEKYAQTGCEIQPSYLSSFSCAGVECWHNGSVCIKNDVLTADATPCSSNADCLSPKKCESNLIDPAAQRTCKLPVAIGERCWTSTFGNNLPCDFGYCNGYVCKAYAKRGERCNVDGGIPACDPFHVCNRGFCVKKYGVDEGKPCTTSTACGTGYCDSSAAICAPISRQRCMGESDCPPGATCKSGTCFNPEILARRALLSCMSTSKIFAESAPGRNLTALVLDKCQKYLGKWLCTTNCFARPEDYELVSGINLDGLDMPIAFDRVVKINCASGAITPLTGQCSLRPSHVWENCEAVGRYSPAGIAVPIAALVALLAAVAATLF